MDKSTLNQEGETRMSWYLFFIDHWRHLIKLLVSTYNLQCCITSKSQCGVCLRVKEETVNTELFKGTAAQLFCGDCLAAKARAVRVNSSDLEAKIRKRKYLFGWVGWPNSYKKLWKERKSLKTRKKQRGKNNEGQRYPTDKSDQKRWIWENYMIKYLCAKRKSK